MACLHRNSTGIPSLLLIVTQLVALIFGDALAFQPTCAVSKYTRNLRISRSSGSTGSVEIHPAVVGWPEKYAGSSNNDKVGPRVLHEEFTVEKATQSQLDELDVTNWPTWTTGDKPKWAVGNQNKDKVMPYGELSYVLSGKLEIIPDGGEVSLVEKGDLVTFPEGFQSDWKVLEELTWHYYLY